MESDPDMPVTVVGDWKSGRVEYDASWQLFGASLFNGATRGVIVWLRETWTGNPFEVVEIPPEAEIIAKLTAQGITETTNLDNPQQLPDSLITVTPTVIAVHTVVTDRVKARIAKVALSKIGSLAQNAVQRKKDQDGITALDGATTSLPGTGTTLTTGHLAAAASRVRFGGGNEPANPPFYTVLHPYQVKDIYDDVVAGVPISLRSVRAEGQWHLGEEHTVGNGLSLAIHEHSGDVSGKDVLVYDHFDIFDHLVGLDVKRKVNVVAKQPEQGMT